MMFMKRVTNLPLGVAVVGGILMGVLGAHLYADVCSSDNCPNVSCPSYCTPANTYDVRWYCVQVGLSCCECEYRVYPCLGEPDCHLYEKLVWTGKSRDKRSRGICSGNQCVRYGEPG